MRITVYLFCLLSLTVTYAQGPEMFNYQAVIRNGDGELVTETPISLKIAILEGAIDGSEAYSEIHNVTTSSRGSIVLQIGAGTTASGNFSDISWGSNTHYVQTSVDLEGGSNYKVISTSQLVSVPYALYANETNYHIKGDGTDDDFISVSNNDYARYAAYGASDSDPFAIPLFMGFKSRGTVESPTDVNSGDRITGLYGASYTSNTYKVNAAVEMYVGNNPGAGSTPSYMIFGTTAENSTSRQERMRIDEDGNVGIGLVDPGYKLDVSGQINASGFLINGSPISMGVWGENAGDISYTSGNVGIGTLTPQNDLDIVGDATDEDIVAIRNDNYSRYAAYSASDSDPFAIPLFMGFKSRGTVESPADVNSGDRITGLYGATYADNAYKVNAAVEMYVGNNPGAGSYPSYMIFGTTAENSTSRLERMRIDEDGNVGIGLTDPGYKLDVSGQINASEFLIDGSPITSGVWGENAGDISYNSGNVGVGTSSPSYKLDVISNVSTGNRTFFSIENESTSTTSSAAMQLVAGSSVNNTVLRMHGDNYSYSWWGKHGQLKTLGDGLIIEATRSDNSGGDIVFVNGQTGGASVVKTITMKIDGTGNVGIGTDAPSSKLQVKSGDVYLEDIGTGVIVKSPDGNCWRMTVDNSGNLVTTSITCPGN